MDDRYIGVFDSGLGGITVLNELKKRLPYERFIFLADTKNNPYGDKSLEELEVLVKDNIEFLIAKGVKAIVFACNTASILDIESLRKEYKLPIVTVLESTVSAIKKEDSKILVAATEAVSSSRKHEELINSKFSDKFVKAQACKDIVPSIEYENLSAPDIQNVVDKYMASYSDKGYDALILGCTHYPIWKDYFARSLPEARIIDPAYATALKTWEMLEKHNILRSAETDSTREDCYYVSGDKEIFTEKLEDLFGLKNKRIFQI